MSFVQQCGVITGASSGIGRATAVELARRGIGSLVLHCHTNVDGLAETEALVIDVARQYKSNNVPLTIRKVSADLAVGADRERLVDQAFEHSKDIAIWVNNAGADVLTPPMCDASFEQKLWRLWNVDVAGTIELSRRVVDRLKATRSDNSGDNVEDGQMDEQGPPVSMTFIGWDQSAGGMEGDAGQMFSPIKAAITAFAQSLAQDVGPGIRVNTVAPGWIKTAWGDTTHGYWDDRAKGQSLMQRWGRPEDVARAIAFVSDPSNTFVNGQVIEVNGGFSRRFPSGDAT